MITVKSYKVIGDLNRFVKTNRAKNLILNQLFIFILSVFPAFSQINTTDLKQQKPKTPERILSLFDSDEILEISLRFELTDFLEKTARAKSFDGILTIHFSETDSLNKKVTIKYRGTSRYQNCRFPPMQINFKKPISVSSDSGRIKKMKLVNQCERGTLYDEYIMRECLVYKLYNVLTDTCFRVRLLKVNYIDTKKGKKPFTQYGFFIEPIELLAKRTNAFVVKTISLTQRDIVPEMMDRLAIFNYMICNWDWSIPGQHNVAVVKSSKYDVTGLGVPVPFDFDLSGVVNAEYAIPPPEMGIENNRVRVFTGICRSKEVFKEDLMMFLNKKGELYSVINEYPYLGKTAKRDITLLLDQFFNQLEKQKSIDNLIDLFLDRCKKL
jgi:hypothetical protein